jgi:transposase
MHITSSTTHSAVSEPPSAARLAQLEAENQQLRWQVAQLKKQLYGPASEKAETYVEEQGLLDVLAERGEPPATDEVVLPADEKEEPAPKKSRRHRAPATLQRVTTTIDPPDTHCPHCGIAGTVIGFERSERIEYIPAKLIVQEIIRRKWAFKCGEGGVAIAPVPPNVIERGRPGPGLVSFLVCSKFIDHLPLHRLQQSLERLGVHIPSSTLCDWVSAAAQWLQPVVREMKLELLAGDYVQVDETPVRILDPDIKGKCGSGYLWVVGRPFGDVVFEFHPGRGTEYAQQLLGNFKGYLQRDGYGVYGQLAREGAGRLLPCGCLAHARRKFVEAQFDEPAEAQWVLGQIQKLYRIEKHARTEAFTPAQRYELRQSLAPPLWATLKVRLEQLQPTLLPKSPLGKAVKYMLNEWEPLQTYLSDGRLEIDNNLTENAIRPTAVGKKNWLFIGHPDAGWRSAVIYSIIVSCRRRKLDPWAYIQDLLTRLPSATNQQIPEFTPARWKPPTAPS